MTRPTGLAVVVALALASAGMAAQASDKGHETGAKAAMGTVTARARAEIAGEGITGTAEFVETTYDTGREVSVTVSAKGLKPGLHGVHLHAIGKCEPPAFTAAGG